MADLTPPQFEEILSFEFPGFLPQGALLEFWERVKGVEGGLSIDLERDAAFAGNVEGFETLAKIGLWRLKVSCMKVAKEAVERECLALIERRI